jgi:hypothetical protein
MLPRDRVLAALSYQAPDIIPLQIHPSPAGLYEHGDKLLQLMQRCGHDFGEAAQFALPTPPPPGDFDPDGRYHAFSTDEWGTRWEYRLFGVWGHRLGYPLADLAALPAYRAPAPPPAEGPAFAAEQAEAAAHRRRYALLGSGGQLFETMQSLRPFADVLVDITLDTPEINRIADIVMEYMAALVRRSLALDVDAVAFGDDFGTQGSLLLSPSVWRRFFKPRYQELFAPIRQVGKRILFHSCGAVGPLLPDLADLGVAAVWPQLPLYDLPELAQRCRDLGLAVQLHPDRGELLQRGTPEQVRSHVYRLCETFDTAHGGSWLYIEIDPGFPWANIEALFAAAMALRGG